MVRVAALWGNGKVARVAEPGEGLHASPRIDAVTAPRSLNRREFLRRALSLAPVAIAVPSAVSYFLAPAGGWPALSPRQIEAMKRALERRAWLAANPPLLVPNDPSAASANSGALEALSTLGPVEFANENGRNVYYFNRVVRVANGSALECNGSRLHFDILRA